MSAADMAGHFSGGWGAFYATDHDVDAGNAHLRTYHGRQAEKFFETFKQPHVPPRPGKASVPPRPESYTWGIGGTLPVGRFHARPSEAAEFKFSQKKFIAERPSVELKFEEDLGRKRHVYDPLTGDDLHNARSESFVLEDTLQRKGRVPEERRCDKRSIFRMAPPGLKGYMGSEYSEDFFRTPQEPPPPPTGGSRLRKSFRQKRAEEDVADQVRLVERALGDIPLETGEGECMLSDDEGGVGEES